MRWIDQWIILAGLSVSMAGCASEPLFPESVLKDLDLSRQFSISDPETDVYLADKTVLVGGRMVRFSTESEGIVIVADELRFREGQPYGVVEAGPPLGQYAVFYPSELDEQALQFGNKFLAVGKVEHTRSVSVAGIPRTVPVLIAQCLHIWETGRNAIAEFPYLGGGYYPLPHQTHCVPHLGQ